MDSRDSNVTPPEESPETTTPAPAPSTEPQSQPVQPVWRVTAETSPSQLSKLKNEKAAAGRASAAARKAKTERLERELAAAKEALRDPAFVADSADAPTNEEAAPPRPQRDKKEEDPALFTWPVGALVAAVGGLAYWSQFHRAEPSPPPEEKKPPVLLSSAGSAQQLKVAHNPHYVE